MLIVCTPLLIPLKLSLDEHIDSRSRSIPAQWSTAVTGGKADWHPIITRLLGNRSWGVLWATPRWTDRLKVERNDEQRFRASLVENKWVNDKDVKQVECCLESHSVEPVSWQRISLDPLVGKYGWIDTLADHACGIQSLYSPLDSEAHFIHASLPDEFHSTEKETRTAGRGLTSHHALRRCYSSLNFIRSFDERWFQRSRSSTWNHTSNSRSQNIPNRNALSSPNLVLLVLSPWGRVCVSRLSRFKDYVSSDTRTDVRIFNMLYGSGWGYRNGTGKTGETAVGTVLTKFVHGQHQLAMSPITIDHQKCSTVRKRSQTSTVQKHRHLVFLLMSTAQSDVQQRNPAMWGQL